MDVDGHVIGWGPNMCLDSRKLGPGGTQRGYSRSPEQMGGRGQVALS